MLPKKRTYIYIYFGISRRISEKNDRSLKDLNNKEKKNLWRILYLTKLQDQYFKLITLQKPLCFCTLRRVINNQKNWRNHICNVDHFDLLINNARSHELHQYETKRQYRKLWIQDKVKIETLQLPVNHFFCLHLHQGKVTIFASHLI